MKKRIITTDGITGIGATIGAIIIATITGIATTVAIIIIGPTITVVIILITGTGIIGSKSALLPRRRLGYLAFSTHGISQKGNKAMGIALDNKGLALDPTDG